MASPYQGNPATNKPSEPKFQIYPTCLHIAAGHTAGLVHPHSVSIGDLDDSAVLDALVLYFQGRNERAGISFLQTLIPGVRHQLHLLNTDEQSGLSSASFGDPSLALREAIARLLMHRQNAAGWDEDAGNR